MASNNRGGTRTSTRGRAGRNNNPRGRNQYTGILSTARESPLATAAAVGGAVAAGLFLWSRRNQISEQISNLGDQISDWRDRMESGDARENSDGRSQTEIAEEALTLKEIGKPA